MPFLEGLLPEGEARTTIERRFNVRRGDVLGLLAAIGRDCAGAVVFQTEHAEPPATGPADLEPITHDDIVAEIQALASFPLGADDRVRVSLAGLRGSRNSP